MWSKLSAFQLRLGLFVCWLVIFLFQSEPFQLLVEYGAFTFLGILGAVFANATGAGGGVVFMPFFNQLDFTVATSVATSFAIQCCGMTAGAVTWWAYSRKIVSLNHIEKDEWLPLSTVLGLSVPFSVLGIWMVQISPETFVAISDPHNLHTGFGIFSIGLAIAIFATVLFVRYPQFNTRLAWFDFIAICLIALIGGGITAWLSIGVGELLAVYLIIRGFNVTFAIAAAVILSAFSVWGGIIFHLFVTKAVYWPVVLFAGLGAIIGGILAKHLVLFFSARSLKLFFAGWVFILGISSLPIF